MILPPQITSRVANSSATCSGDSSGNSRRRRSGAGAALGGEAREHRDKLQHLKR